jgi:TonB family protein
VALLERHLEGKYEILDKIKEGGMGAVYKVRHRFLDEIRVIKVIRPALQQSQELADRFLREARMAILLRHPSIAVLHDFAVSDDGQAFIVMEYIAGLTLEEVLISGGPPPLGLALEVASQALRAMGYLHRHGLVHRDVAPDNLMLTRGVDGEPLVKLIDLGIAKVLAGEGAATTTGIFLGKPRYASPEHFGTREMDHRSDLYSFGVVMYELLTGQCPVSGHDPASYMAGHLFRPPLGLAESDPNATLPAELGPIVLRALAKTPVERFPSAADFARALAPLQERFPVQAGDLDAALQPAAHKTAPWAAPAPAGSSQVLLDRQFLAGTTPPPAAHAGSHLHWDPNLIAPETLQPATEPPSPAPPAPPPSADSALDETLPLTARQRMPAPPRTAAPPAAPPRAAAPSAAPPRATAPLASRTLQGVRPARPPGTAAGELPMPAVRSREASAPSPAAEDWEATPLHRTGPPRAARAAAAGTPNWAWVTLALLLAAGALAGVAWWYRQPQAPAARAGSTRTGAAPKTVIGEAPQAAGAAGAAVESALQQPPAAGMAQRPAPAPAQRDDFRTKPQAQPGHVDARTPEERASAGGRRTPPASPASAASAAGAAGPAPATEAGSAAAAIPAPERLGPGAEAAEPIDVPDAVYPAAARGSGKSPTVRLAVLVDEHGNVADVRVKEGDSSHLGFNEAAVAAARKARFLAATRNGTSVRSWSELIIEFVSPPAH